jgi:lysozyme
MNKILVVVVQEIIRAVFGGGGFSTSAPKPVAQTIARSVIGGKLKLPRRKRAVLAPVADEAASGGQSSGEKALVGSGPSTAASAPAPTPVPAQARPAGLLSLRAHLEIIEHEAIVPEAYLCSAGHWTWSVGVTNASGHKVHPRYRNNPQTLERCLEVYEWLVREKYLPAVLRAFGDTRLSEHQLAAALSFHWNTGRIESASWVKFFRAGKLEQAEREIMNWRSPPEIIPRREKERDLFFKGKWAHGQKARWISRVNPGPRANPIWSSAELIDIRPTLSTVLERAGQ